MTDIRRDLHRIEQILSTVPQFSWPERARVVRDVHHAMHAAFEIEPHGTTHHAAAALFHRTRSAVYPSEVGDEFDHLQPDDPNHLEVAFQFLEADPWFFRSGYVKADLLRQIGRVTLPPAYVKRLQHIVLAAVDAGDRREFRRYCRAARRIDNPSLREALAQRIEGANVNVRRRAQWMLDVMNSR